MAYNLTEMSKDDMVDILREFDSMESTPGERRAWDEFTIGTPQQPGLFSVAGENVTWEDFPKSILVQAIREGESIFGEQDEDSNIEEIDKLQDSLKLDDDEDIIDISTNIDDIVDNIDIIDDDTEDIDIVDEEPEDEEIDEDEEPEDEDEEIEIIDDDDDDIVEEDSASILRSLLAKYLSAPKKNLDPNIAVEYGIPKDAVNKLKKSKGYKYDIKKIFENLLSKVDLDNLKDWLNNIVVYENKDELLEIDDKIIVEETNKYMNKNNRTVIRKSIKKLGLDLDNVKLDNIIEEVNKHEVLLDMNKAIDILKPIKAVSLREELIPAIAKLNEEQLSYLASTFVEEEDEIEIDLTNIEDAEDKEIEELEDKLKQLKDLSEDYYYTFKESIDELLHEVEELEEIEEEEEVEESLSKGEPVPGAEVFVEQEEDENIEECNKSKLKEDENIEECNKSKLKEESEECEDDCPDLTGLADKNNTLPEDVDQDQLLMGIDVEMEHTEDPLVATQIALDHLTEIPDYYSKLEEMEDEAKEEGDFNDDIEESIKLDATPEEYYIKNVVTDKKYKKTFDSAADATAYAINELELADDEFVIIHTVEEEVDVKDNTTDKEPNIDIIELFKTKPINEVAKEMGEMGYPKIVINRIYNNLIKKGVIEENIDNQVKKFFGL